VSPMKKLPRPGGGEYCIDATEASNEHYSQFLAESPSTANQPAGCTGNTFVPPSTFECHWNPTTEPNAPVRCVDWCDAFAFCKQFGKRLCGGVSGGGAATPTSGVNQHTQSEWFNACTEGGVQDYVFGNSYTSSLWGTCNGLEKSSNATDVGTLSGCQCQSPYNGVFDLNGNVREWENACNGSNQCASRGGGHNDSGDPGSGERMRCDSAVFVARTDQSEFRGIRCCADLE
jgi:formylglycine-generating enzyme required for sulfatase activity